MKTKPVINLCSSFTGDFHKKNAITHYYFVWLMHRIQQIFIVAILWLVSLQSAYSQNINYVRQLLDTLCAPAYHGRGYEYEADRKAAAFISEEISKLNLQAFEDGYFQYFTFPINTFPGAMELKIDGENMEPGVDFLVHPASAGAKGEFDILLLDSRNLQRQRFINRLKNKDLSGNFILLDTANLPQTPANKTLVKQIATENMLNAAGIIEIKYSALVFGVSQWQHDFVHIQLRHDAKPKTTKTTYVYIEAGQKERYRSQNIAAYIKGRSDSLLVFSAHYDHLGRMGRDTYFPGAHDNASGTAMLLDLARHFSTDSVQPYYTLAFVWFSAEEAGLIGSRYMAFSPLFSLQKTKLLLNLDLVGSGDGGIQVVNATEFEPEFQLLQRVNTTNNYLVAVKPRGPAANSDHYFFYERGVPAFFIYTLGEYKEYHNIHDTAENVPLSEYENFFRLIRDFTYQLHTEN